MDHVQRAQLRLRNPIQVAEIERGDDVSGRFRLAGIDLLAAKDCVNLFLGNSFFIGLSIGLWIARRRSRGVP